MKNVFLSLTLLLTVSVTLPAQSIETGIEFYEQGDYERALRVFEQSETPEAYLFAGKSYFALNNYLRALNYLNRVDEIASIDLYHEAIYTAALAKFQLEDYTSSLELLEDLSDAQPSSATSRSALPLYDQILRFLTPDQRREVFRRSGSNDVRFDVLESAVGNGSYSTAKILVKIFKEAVPEYDQLRMSRMESMLSDSVSYNRRFNSNFVSAPKGISYDIGVLLPQFDYDTPEYEISQQLYYGIQLAVEQFNNENTDQKVFLTYKNTINGASEAEEIITDLVWNTDVDFTIGPLFSEVAKVYADLAEDYKVPMLLPLANADSLDLYNDYVYQLNPAFGIQGRQMARYAVNVLGYDTLGVIAEKGSLGAPAARAFLREAERLGAFVRYYFEEDFSLEGYDIRDYTQYFTTDVLDSVDIVQAVYAPFTGAVAPTLVESMLTDLEAMRSKVHILGSEEWMNVDLNSRRLNDTELYYTESFRVDTSEEDTRDFISSFRLRFDTMPDQFAYIGYDAASVVLDVILKSRNPAVFREELSLLRNYKGLSIDVSFNGSHVNNEVRIIKKERFDDNAQFLPPQDRRR